MSKKVVDPVEPIVINDELIREAIVIPEDESAVDPHKSKEEIEFHEVTFLSFSYKGAQCAPVQIRGDGCRAASQCTMESPRGDEYCGCCGCCGFWSAAAAAICCDPLRSDAC